MERERSVKDMEEEVVVEMAQEAAWTPPVLKRERVRVKQSCADVFFIQYAACVLMLTALLVIRLYDEAAFDNAVAAFRAQTQAPDETWADSLLALAASLWS
ncbi:MAG: hypothetical protein IJ055_03485 [Oscillospiraceae bacterium]|nr:hypothetical protein [Oscillospiraceae bacterium]